MQVPFKLVAAAAAAIFVGSVSAQDLVVKIGHVAPTSGGIAHLGKDNENAARMAIDELNAKGLSWGWFQGGFKPAPAPNPPLSNTPGGTGPVICGSTHAGVPGTGTASDAVTIPG